MNLKDLIPTYQKVAVERYQFKFTVFTVYNR